MNKDQTRETVWAAFFHNDNDKNRPVTVVVRPVKPGGYLLSVQTGETLYPVFARKIQGGTDTSVKFPGGTSQKLIIVITSDEGSSDVLHLGQCWR